ncbi:ribonuclease Z [Scandinavium goeteborgense]|uniref:Ribonuclease BN n=1 Tax=Scandinavium goeteborgense TaxID=1851514 RepID=A0A4R6EN02_SCAGO|nr:ribonuclease Z [Scandinavium goeteborgense]QKN81066.1 ribonuclease Z [Scandinavium goeteborgense]TDN60581.1 ribonuclease Z [Scandinavium goeteborgense]
MELIFLGTSAGVPTRHRNMTSILLNLQQPTLSQMWLFDCGEGTQHQFLKTSHHPGKLDKIFITHLHGDHLFGLPGLLCSRSMQGNPSPLTIYGPKGIKEFVEMALRLSGSWTDYPLTVEEISAGEVFDDGLFKVTAYPLNHPVECYGYRIEQHDKPGPLDAQRLLADGIKAGPLFQQLKKGQTVEMPDGRIVNGQDYLGPSTPGVKLAIFGDTAPCPAALAMAKEVDVMVHETTLEHEMAEKANSRGHSSSIQTAELARDAHVGKLIITHVSSRYDWEGCQRLLAECRSVFEPCELAEDFRVFPLA